MKRIYDAPVMNVELFATEDVIAVSALTINATKATAGTDEITTVDAATLDFN